MPKKQYFVKNAVDHDNKRYEAGSAIVLDDTAAEPLLAASVIEIDVGAPTIEEEGLTPSNATERLAAITTAIGQLDPSNGDAWLRDGRPDISSIVAITGWTITAAERNAAWAALQPAP